MMARPKRPEPLQPGDGQVAREEIEAYYAQQIERAAAELAAAQERFNSVKENTDNALAAFHAGERLPDLDAWSIELHAGGHMEIGEAILRGRSNDRDAYDRARARHEATARWLRHEGYEPIDGAR